ncbi:MAG TPA: phage holin family protein [Candidatus Omnitrophota bacterium]|nr:phage holin family protein [Candidatus Omnitrophota bacterium]
MFVKWWVNVVALLLVVLMVPGIHVDKFSTALLAALCLGLVNAVLRPLLIAFTLPLNIMSLGLFTLIINGVLFFGVSRLIPGFVVVSFWTAVWGALAFGIFSFILNMLIAPSGRIQARFYCSSGSKRDSATRRRGDIIDVEGKAEERDNHRKTLGR